MRVKISQVLFTSYVTACPKSLFVYRTVYKRLLWQVNFDFAEFKATSISETSNCWAAYQSEGFFNFRICDSGFGVSVYIFVQFWGLILFVHKKKSTCPRYTFSFKSPFRYNILTPFLINIK